MSVRVIVRVRPLLRSENEKDTIVKAIQDGDAASSAKPCVIKLPNPKNLSEDFTFRFNSVYGQQATQQELFDAESKRSKPLFNLPVNTRGRMLIL